MHGEARQLYREMLEEGYDPNRGLGPIFVLIIVSGFVASATALVAFASFSTMVSHLFDNFFGSFFLGL